MEQPPEANHFHPEASVANEPDTKHPLQRLMDNPWALLALGVLVPTLSYTAWGWIELLLLPIGQLP